MRRDCPNCGEGLQCVLCGMDVPDSDFRPALSDLGMAITILRDCGHSGIPLAIDTIKAGMDNVREEAKRAGGIA